MKDGEGIKFFFLQGSYEDGSEVEKAEINIILN